MKRLSQRVKGLGKRSPRYFSCTVVPCFYLWICTSFRKALLLRLMRLLQVKHPIPPPSSPPWQKNIVLPCACVLLCPCKAMGCKQRLEMCSNGLACLLFLGHRESSIEQCSYRLNSRVNYVEGIFQYPSVFATPTVMNTGSEERWPHRDIIHISIGVEKGFLLLHSWSHSAGDLTGAKRPGRFLFNY